MIKGDKSTFKKAIFKYPAPIEDRFVLKLPASAEILSVQVQDGEPQVWALVLPDALKVVRRFAWIGTGHAHPETFWEDLTYVGTVQLQGGALVFHLFEELAP